MADPVDLSPSPPTPNEGFDDKGSVDATVQCAANETEAATSSFATLNVEEKQEEKEEEEDGTDDTFGNRIVHLFVGPKRVKYTIHEQVLSNVAKNSFFSVLFNNGFQETSAGKAEMPEDDPRPIAHLIKWLYAAHIGVKEFHYLFNSLHLERLFQLYNVGQKYLVGDLQDAIITTVYKKLQCEGESAFISLLLDHDAFDEFQDNTLPGSNMYKLVTRAMAVSMARPTFTVCSCGNIGGKNLRFCRDCTSMAEEVLPVISDDLMRSLVSELLRTSSSSDHKTFTETVGALESFMIEKRNSTTETWSTGWNTTGWERTGWGRTGWEWTGWEKDRTGARCCDR